MIWLVDNYDSFSYNLYQLIGSISPDIRVVRNDAVTPEEIEAAGAEALILSPGPGKPGDAGICEEAVIKLGGRIPILGVCLGHQAICEAYGGKIEHAAKLMHGKSSMMEIVAESLLFEGLPREVRVGRYHSLSLKRETLPEELEVTAVADDGEVMAVSHREYPVYGLQFHPESILTPEGKKILGNFIKTVELFHSRKTS